MTDHTEQQLNCALHGPMIKNPTGLWYTKNASGNYSTYAPPCTCDYSDDEGESDNDSAMSNDNQPQPQTQNYYKMQVEEDDDEEEESMPSLPPPLEKHDADFVMETQKMHTQVQLDCALHGPMIKNPSGLWYSKNASGSYSMYAPSCTCDYSDDEL